MEQCYQVMSKKQAEDFGFTIESDFCMVFDMGCVNAVLGYNSLEGMWQFDTGIYNGDTWQFIEKDLNKAINKAEAVTKMVRAYVEYLVFDGVSAADVDFVGMLDKAFEGCEDVRGIF